MLKEESKILGLEKKGTELQGEQYSTNFEVKVDDFQALYKVRKEKREIEQTINM